MQFSEFVENEDGSCSTHVDLSSEETQMLIQYALVKLLKDHVESEEYMDDRLER
jgi:hypothetical protein